MEVLWAAPLAVTLGHGLASYDASGLAAALGMSLLLLGISLDIIRQGVRENRLGLLNAGMLLLGLLILMRFFDYSYSFMARGAAFIFLGLTFLAINWRMSRRRDGVVKLRQNGGTSCCFCCCAPPN